MFRDDGMIGMNPQEERQRVRDSVKGTFVSFVAMCALIRLSMYTFSHHRMKYCKFYH